MLAQVIHINFYSPARSLRQIKFSLLHFRIGFSRFLDFRVRKFVEMLEYFPVSQSGHQVQCSRRADNSANIVRCDHHRIRFGRRTNFLGFQNAAALRHVRLKYLHGAPRKQVPELCSIVIAFAGCNGDPRVPRYNVERSGIFRPARLFDPSRVEFFNGFSNFDSLMGRESSVHFHKHLISRPAPENTASRMSKLR